MARSSDSGMERKNTRGSDKWEPPVCSDSGQHTLALHSQRGTALDTQPGSSREQWHTETRGQLAATDEHLNSHLIFPTFFV